MRRPNLSCALVILAVIAFLTPGCKSTDPGPAPPDPIDGRVLVEPTRANTDCIYGAGTLVADEVVSITVAGTGGNQFLWGDSFSGTISKTYEVKVPSSGSFNIAVIIVEQKSTPFCLACSAACNNNTTAGKARWRGNTVFTGIQQGNQYDVLVNFLSCYC